MESKSVLYGAGFCLSAVVHRWYSLLLLASVKSEIQAKTCPSNREKIMQHFLVVVNNPSQNLESVFQA